jgi:hypothetical protein
MALKTVIASLDDVDEVFREHYVETKDPKDPAKVQFVLGIEGSIDPLPGVKALRTENGSFRIKLRDTEQKYGKLEAFKDMDPAEVLSKLDRIAELELAAGGKLDDKAIETIVESRIKTKTAPLERQLQTVTQERDTFKVQVEEFSTRDKKRLVEDDVRAAAVKMKMLPEAVEDAIMYADRVMEVNAEGVVSVKDKVGFTPGLDVASWLGDMQAKRPHWWPASAGGGGRGNSGGGNGVGGPNPWSNENWNITEQNRIYKEDKKKAEQLATNAGTKLGGTRPVAKK